MKGPQLEDGYTRIANEILEKTARFRLTGMQSRILMVVWRNTYGFKRKEAELSLSYLAEAVGVKKQHVAEPLNELIAINAIQVVGKRGNTRLLAFNKYFDQWKFPERSQTPPDKKNKEGKQEKKRKRNERPVYDENNQFYLMAVYLHQKIKQMAADIGFNHASIAKVDLQKWANDFRLLWERDGVQDKHLIKDVIDWVMEDEFWRTNILSAGKLRKQFSRLVLAMKGRKQGGKTNRQMSQNERLMKEIREEMERDQNGSQEAVLDNKQLLLDLPD